MTGRAIVVRPQDLDFTRYVRPGDAVVWGQACAEPLTLTEQLMAQRARIGPFRCFLGVAVAATVRPEHADCVSFSGYSGGGPNGALARAGLLDVLPVPYSTLPDVLHADVVLLQLAPPDAHGRYSLGLAADYLPPLIAAARVVIAEVSDQVPASQGPHTLTDADLDVVVHTSRPPAELRQRPLTEADRAIGQHVAGLIEDGATLQVGIGALPEAVLAALTEHRDLGLHSGQLSDGAAELLRRGVLTNARKSLDRGRAVAGFVLGSRAVFDVVHRNPAVELRETRYTHNPDVLAAQDRFVAINAAIEVDLTGQVNAEVAAGRYVGAVGGAPDFLRGAARSRGGLPIVVLPATAVVGGERRSRIVSRLSGPVSTARCDAGLVVTEFGVADLRGRTARQRRDALIAIAHPEHRAELDETTAVGGSGTAERTSR